MINRQHINKYQTILVECNAVATLRTRQTFVSICTLLSTIATDLYPRERDNVAFTNLIDNYLIRTNRKYQELNPIIDLYNIVNSEENHNIGRILYKKLRCSLIHNDIPEHYFNIAHRYENQTGHLTIENNRIILVAEDLLEDIKNMIGLIIRDSNVYNEDDTTPCNEIICIDICNNNSISIESPLRASGLPNII